MCEGTLQEDALKQYGTIILYQTAVTERPSVNHDFKK